MSILHRIIHKLLRTQYMLCQVVFDNLCSIRVQTATALYSVKHWKLVSVSLKLCYSF